MLVFQEIVLKSFGFLKRKKRLRQYFTAVASDSFLFQDKITGILFYVKENVSINRNKFLPILLRPQFKPFGKSLYLILFDERIIKLRPSVAEQIIVFSDQFVSGSCQVNLLHNNLIFLGT